MEVQTKTTVDMLTKDSVGILTQKFIEVDGTPQQVGKNHRTSYVNSNFGRSELKREQQADVVASVFAIWGDTPTVEEPETETE